MRRDKLARRTLELLGELTRFARWLCVDTDGGDDLVQEAVSRALAKAGSLRQEARVKAWLFQIVRNVHLDQRRAQATRERLVVLEGGLDELTDVELPVQDLRGYERRDLEAALGQLPEAARSALLLSDLWGFDVGEIATILDIPTGTVKSRVARARARVAAILVGHEVRPRARRGT